MKRARDFEHFSVSSGKKIFATRFTTYIGPHNYCESIAAEGIKHLVCTVTRTRWAVIHDDILVPTFFSVFRLFLPTASDAVETGGTKGGRQKRQHQRQTMTIVAFVIDTSESMSAKTASGCSLMDHAKNVVEQMTVKKRQTPAHFVLLTSTLLLSTEDWPLSVKFSWTDWAEKPEKRAARYGRDFCHCRIKEVVLMLPPCPWLCLWDALLQIFMFFV